MLAGIRPDTEKAAPAVFFLALAALVVFVVNLPPLERYPAWDAFWGDAMSVANLLLLRQAITEFQLPAIIPYTDFGWNALGDTTLVQSYLNPVNWLVLIIAPETVIVIRNVIMFWMLGWGAYVFAEGMGAPRRLALLAGALACAMPLHLVLLWGEVELSFVYFAPFLLHFLGRWIVTPTPAAFAWLATTSLAAVVMNDVHVIFAYVPLIGAYALWVGIAMGRPILSVAWRTFVAGVLFLAAGAVYFVPFLYNIYINGLFKNELVAAGVAPPGGADFDTVWSLMFKSVLKTIVEPLDTFGLVLYVPAFICFTMVAAVFFGGAARNAKLGAAIGGLLLASLCLVLESFLFHSLPWLSRSATGMVRVQTAVIPVLLLLAGLLAAAHLRAQDAGGAASARRPGLRALALTAVLAFAFDLWLFLLPKPVPGAAADVGQWINHSPAGLESTAWFPVWIFGSDPWAVLPLANLIIAIIVLFALYWRRVGIVATGAFAIVAAAASTSYVALHTGIRQQQPAWAWHVRSDARKTALEQRRACLNELAPPRPGERTLIAGEQVFGRTGRSWQFVADSELHAVDGRNLLFSYRNTTHATTSLQWSVLQGETWFRWQNLWPLSTSEVVRKGDLAHRLGVRWLVSSGQPLHGEQSDRLYRPVFLLYGANFNFAYKIADAAPLRGKDITVTVNGLVEEGRFRIRVIDGGASTLSDFAQTGADGRAVASVTHRVTDDAQSVVVRLVEVEAASRLSLLLDQATIDVAGAGPLEVDLNDWDGRTLPDTPPGWIVDGLATIIKRGPVDRAKVEEDWRLVGECQPPSEFGPSGPEATEDAVLYVYERRDPLGIAFLAEDAQSLPQTQILQRMLKDDWTADTVLLDGDAAGTATGQPPSGRAWLTEEGINSMSVDIATPDSAWLAVTMTDRPFWRAYADGARIPIERAYGGFMATHVPAGTSKVTFVYVPWDGYLGLAISVVCVGWTWVRRYANARPPRPETR